MVSKCDRCTNRDRLRVCHDLNTPAAPIVAEVGRELGALFEAARNSDGKVVCVLPLHRPSSLMEKQADTSGWNDLIISLPDLCRLLHLQGSIDAEAHKRGASVSPKARPKESVTRSNHQYFRVQSIWTVSACPISRMPVSWRPSLLLVWTFVFIPTFLVTWMNLSPRENPVKTWQLR